MYYNNNIKVEIINGYVVTINNNNIDYNNMTKLIVQKIKNIAHHISDNALP